MSTFKELLQKRDDLDIQLADARSQAKAAAIVEILRLIAEFDVASTDIFGSSSARSKPKPLAKYRNPETGETWSGRGREPAWIAGHDRHRFLIKADKK